MPRPPRVSTFFWDDENEGKIARHGLRPSEIDSLLDGRHAIRKNRKARRGRFLLTGRTVGGEYVTVVLESTFSQGLWRPVTAWRSKLSEIRRVR